MNRIDELKKELEQLEATHVDDTADPDADPPATPEERVGYAKHLADHDLMQEPFDFRTFVYVHRVFKELGLKGFQN